MPAEMVLGLDRLSPHNRTAHVNKAVRTYLEIQGSSRNRYGVDCAYFKGKLGLIMRDMENFTPEELARSLNGLAVVAGRTHEHA